MRHHPASPACPSGTRRPCGVWCALALLAGAVLTPSAQAFDAGVSGEQRSRAMQVASAGVPLSELATNAPESHTVQRGDTLWDIAKMFLKSPWRWPDLWGMNLAQIRNPHLIYPGQVLVLVRNGDRAQLRIARADQSDGQLPTNTVKLSPKLRSQLLENGAIAAIPLNLIGPFLNEAVVLNEDELAQAPRIVATQEGRVMVSRGEVAYVRGDLRGERNFTLFREAKPLRDPVTRELLGYEAGYVGTAEFSREASQAPAPDGKGELPVPARFVVTTVRQEAGIGDRLAPVPPRDFSAFVPHSPGQPISGRIVSVYGGSMTAAQNQVVALSRGKQDGIERGHVLALWTDGKLASDATQPGRAQPIKLPDEALGLLFVFRVFDRVSYALVLSAQDSVKPGDRFTQP